MTKPMTCEAVWEKYVLASVSYPNATKTEIWNAAWQASRENLGGEPYGYVWFDKNMERRISGMKPHDGQLVMDCKPVFLHPDPKMQELEDKLKVETERADSGWKNANVLNAALVVWEDKVRIARRSLEYYASGGDYVNNAEDALEKIK